VIELSQVSFKQNIFLYFILWFVLKPCQALDYIAWNRNMIGKWWIDKDMEGSGRSIIQALSGVICLEGLRKTIEYLSYRGRCADLDSNQISPQHECRTRQYAYLRGFILSLMHGVMEVKIHIFRTFGIIRTWVISFTPKPLCPGWKSHRPPKRRVPYLVVVV
jgi:hypothetical protein